MTELLDTLRHLHRPRLLIRAARHGMVEYNRNRDLKRVLRHDSVPGPQTALPRLMEAEAELEQVRRSGDASYSVVHHIQLLVALMSEARLLGRPASI